MVASIVSGILAGVGSFYVAAKPEVNAVEKQSENADVILCQVTNENRALTRGIVEGAVRTEEIPPNAPSFFRQYLERRNLGRGDLVQSVRDRTRPLDCNTYFHDGGAVP